MKKLFRIFKNAVCVLLVLVFALIVFVTVSGAKGYAVATNSMSPRLKKGDVVFVKETDFSELKKGDIVTVEFKTGDGTYTHRISSIDYKNKEIKTIGDNIGQVDAEGATDKQVKGKVWFSVPLLGYLSLLLTNRAYGAVVVIAAIAVMAAGIIVSKTSKKERGCEDEHKEKV